MRAPANDGPIAVLGGSGFIGSNLADSLLAAGERVVVVDNLSRPGVEQNLAWLQSRHGGLVSAEIADIRDQAALEEIGARSKAVFHLAAQTAVTTSLVDPVEDFEVNARGTLNVLEAVRCGGRAVPVIFASTNKVYGALADIALDNCDEGYLPTDGRLRSRGVDETRPLDFCTPYGCSKGVADQYVLDYAKSYGLPTAVLRMSCIYGPRQFGTEDQGWVAHFLIRALAGEPITLYGDGKQVRDVLHVRDAVAAYRAVLDRIHTLKGEVFNLGGGPGNAISLNLLIEQIATILERRIVIRHAEVRTGDQPYFVADTRKIEAALGWRPSIGWRQGVRDLAAWLAQNRFAPKSRQRERVVA